MASRRPPLVRRLAASAMDLLVVAFWAAVSGAGGLTLRAAGIEFTTPAAWDLFAFFTLVLPVVITLAIQEASSAQASLGKRRLGLRVAGRSGTVGPARSLLRSAVKFAPWQMAHTAVFHLAAGSSSPGWLGLSIGAQVVALLSLVLVVFDRHGRALHDVVAGTRVVSGIE